jgi:hypothetical protein
LTRAGQNQVIRRKLVAARRDQPTLFNLIEESFDQIAGSVEMRAEADRLVAIASRRYVGPSALLCDERPDPIGDRGFRQDAENKR